MRRKDREMGREFALDLIDRAPYGVLSVIESDGVPYGLPLSLVRKNDTLYFHSAKEGKKVESFKHNIKVCITFVGETNIPELYSDEELNEFHTDKSKAKHLISRVFTTEYESAIILGKISLIEHSDEIIEAMRLICQKYTPSKMEYFPIAMEASFNRINVYKVTIEQITAKRKRYDKTGEEMKWGRTE